MNNTLGAVQQNLCRSFVLENRSNAHPPISSSLPCKIPSYSKNDQAFLHNRRLRFSTRFLDNSLRDWKTKFQQKMRRVAYLVPHAVLATDSFPKLRGNFKLDENSELQIVLSSKSDSFLQIDFQITNAVESLILHWGAVRTRNNDWSLPSRRPDGTKAYKNEALRTPFVNSGSSSLVKLEIDDPEVQAIEFLIVDEAQNKWFKNDGHNFHIQLSGNSPQILGASIEETIDVTIPEDLVEIYAYLRWEKKGRQTYTPEQEKLEFEEARKELQLELEKGTSLDEIRKRTVKGSIKSQAAKKEDKKRFTIERVLRKSRDLTQFINKHSFQPSEEKTFDTKRTPTTLELWSKGLEERFDGLIITRKFFKLDDMELMVLVADTEGKMKIFLGTDYERPLLLHWALSEKAGEWMAPPSNNLPPNAVLLDEACQAPFINISSADPTLQLQHIELNINAEHYDGMPFVLCSGDHWIKNNGSDFYVEFGGLTTKDLKDVGDGKGTAKALLDKIAQLEGEAMKSFMHRFNIASDLLYQARDAGLLGLAGILVWMRFMATRQLVWNKNYNVKPREISKAQDRLTDMLQDTYTGFPSYREILRIIMSTVGRGGEGDVGQRIRDEILVIQRNNDCKGGMMEEWHQKLHNNTSPDDVVICQALIDYVNGNFDVNVYWKTLNENGITKERLLSYDRAIHSEPNFRLDQKEGLLRDLRNYMRTLKVRYKYNVII